MFIGRSYDIDDVILNMCGGIIGYFLYILIHNLYAKLPKIFDNEWVKLLIVIIFTLFIMFGVLLLFEVIL
jgi:glycopeptide antibiotics resistance protein